jgi:hypothetical protein
MNVEFDRRKSQSNKKKHGIDFDAARELWDDPDLLEVPLRTVDETRFMVIGAIEGILWSGIITYRSSSIRIISVRRSREEEVELYES